MSHTQLLSTVPAQGGVGGWLSASWDMKRSSETTEWSSADECSGRARGAACEHREALMQERKIFVDEHNESVFERPFSLCEH